MFNGESSITIRTEKPFEKVKEVSEEVFESKMGPIEISDKGIINIQGSKFKTFASEVKINGIIKKKDSKYRVSVEYEAEMTTIGWIIAVIGICFALIGLAVFIFPFKSKNDMGKAVESSLQEIKAELED